MPSAVRVVERIRDQSDFAGPLTPLYFMRLTTDGTAFEMAQPTGGSSTSSMKYNFNAGALPPTGSQVRLNNANQTLATQMGVARLTSDNLDMKNVLMLTQVGSRLYLQDENNADSYQVYLVNAAPVDVGTYVLFGVTWQSGGTTVPAGACRLAVLGPPAFGTEDAQDAAAIMILGGTHTGISFAYNDVANVLSATVTAWLGAATSVVGRAFGTSGGVSDIVATADGQVLTRVAGVLAFAAPAGGGGDVYLANANTFTGSPQSIVIGTAANKGLIVRGAASQTANLQEWQNSGGTVEGYFKSGDGFYVGNTYTIGSTGQLYIKAGSGCQVQMNAAFFQIRDVAGNNTGLTLYPSTAAQCVYVLPSAGTKGIIIQGAASQTATLVQLQGISSVQAREMADIDAQWVTSTDASRKAKLVLRVWDTAVREAVSIAASGTGSTISLKGGVVNTPVALTDAATIATDASLSNLFTVTLGGNRTLGNPTNAADGQRITWRVRQDGTGTRTLAYDTKFRFGTDLTSITLSTAINKTDYLTAIYHGGDDRFDLIGVIKGY